ncbi:putative exported protein [Plasmodium gaboni]|uniref:Putative exported protein n=1 Tax=Plasmodium gaboni TaxID=647221 RepID=A0A151LBX3_9APIC|nr:putative exported protein [Plasmodium gaboni]KYN96356.1 putative exported protein [Plasmodium gaboni]
MNKFFVFFIFILGLFNSNKIFYEKYFNISENVNKNNYYLIRRLCEISSNIDEKTTKTLQTHIKSHINNEKDKDLDTISNYDVKDKKSDYFRLLKQEINDAKYDYIDHVNFMNNGSHRNTIKTLRGKLEFYDNLFVDKILDFEIQNKPSPLLDLFLLSLFEILHISCPPVTFIIPVYLIKRFSFLHQFDTDQSTQKVIKYENLK